MLSITNVHKRFGDVHAMNNINLDLQPGLFGLLGPVSYTHLTLPTIYSV